VRFKKLRRNVAIAMILFIFIIGNVIIFGTLSQNHNLNSGITLLAPIYNNESKVGSSQSNNIVTAQNNLPAVQAEPTIPPAIIVNLPVRTRAS
jgi:hypothetical protein